MQNIFPFSKNRLLKLFLSLKYHVTNLNKSFEELPQNCLALNLVTHFCKYNMIYIPKIKKMKLFYKQKIWMKQEISRRGLIKIKNKMIQIMFINKLIEYEILVFFQKLYKNFNYLIIILFHQQFYCF